MKPLSVFGVLLLVGLSYAAAPGVPDLEVNGKKVDTAEIPEATTVKSDGHDVVINSTPEDDIPIVSTVVPDDITTVKPVTTSVEPPNSTTVDPKTSTVPPNSSTTTTTVVPTTTKVTTSVPPITIPPNVTTTTTTVKPKSTTTELPITTAAPHTGRMFDGASFVGGIITAVALAGIGLVIFKFYKSRAERNYHTL